MKLFRRGKYWHVRFQAGGVEVYQSTKAADKDTARLIGEQIYRETILGNHGIRNAPSLAGIAKAWLASKGRTVSPSHKRAAEQSLNSLKPLWKTSIGSLTQGTVDRWAADYLEGHSRASLNLVFRYLKLWLNWAKAEGYLKELPCKLKQEKPAQASRPVVGMDKVEAFLSACSRRNPEIPAAIRCAMMLGMRESEILKLRWQDIRPDSVTIHGKGGKLRTVPMPEPLRLEVGRMLAAQQHGPVPWPTLGLAFPGHKQGWLRQALKRGAAELGIPVLGIHRLRATFATLHMRKGTPLKEVQAMMGHSDPRTTLIYQEVSREEQARHQAELWGAG